MKNNCIWYLIYPIHINDDEFVKISVKIKYVTPLPIFFKFLLKMQKLGLIGGDIS